MEWVAKVTLMPSTSPEHGSDNAPLSLQEVNGLSTMSQEISVPLAQSTKIEMGDVEPEPSCINKKAPDADVYLPAVFEADEMEKIKSCVENLFDLAYNHTSFSARPEVDLMSVINDSKNIIEDIFVKHDLTVNLESESNTNNQNDVNLNLDMLPHEPVIPTGDGENATLKVNETNCKESRQIIKEALLSFSIPTVEKYTFKSLIEVSSEGSIKRVEMFHFRMKKIEENISVMNADHHNEYKQNFVNVIEGKAKQDKNEAWSAPLTDVLYEFGTMDERELKRSFASLMHLLADKRLEIKCEKDSEMLVQEQDPNNEFQPSRKSSNGGLQIANDNIHVFPGEKWSEVVSKSCLE